MLLAPGMQVGPYKILAPLGAGGMGEVYRARDTRLGRDVAIKTLSRELAADPEALDRFRREARALAALDHPGVVAVFSVEEADGIPFLTMQLVEGETLDRLIPAGGMAPARVVEIATSLAEALAAAHDKGVVHRDLKPANVMMTEQGRIKILDFGLALLTHPAQSGLRMSEMSTVAATSPGTLLGTMPYMSPEQVSGGRVDHRTDLFSVGVMLYEMCCGHRPFDGPSQAELASSILRDTPRPLPQWRGDLPEGLVSIVERCLAKDPPRRPADAHELREQLAALGGAGTAAASSRSGGRKADGQTGRDSIAVLPFTDMSPARDHEWFCEGIAEEILNALARLPELRVASRTSAFRFKDPARDLARIGATLGVRTLLEGSVRTAGSRLRVTAQLVDAADARQLWSERFDCQMEDVFAIQDEIAGRVVEALQLRLGKPAIAAPEGQHGKDVEAYHLFLKGRHHRYTKYDLRSALECFERAVARDPAYVEARIAAAETLIALVIYGMIPPSVGRARVMEEMARARELGGESAAWLGVDGYRRLVHDWDVRGALAAFDRSLELDPGSVRVRAWRTWALLDAGRTVEAIEEARRIAQSDPQSPFANAMAGFTLLAGGQVEEALVLERLATEIGPESLLATYMRGWALAAAEAWDEAIEWLEKAVEQSARAPWCVAWLAWATAASGRRDHARALLAELALRAETEYVSPLLSCFAVSELEGPEAARELLAAAFAERASLLVLPGIPPFRKLRAEPLMRDLIERLRTASG